MFGYLTADRALLTPEENARYKAAYCGLCRSLRKRYGQPAGLTLNFDQCFLILLLQSLYEEKETGGEGACVVHPVKRQPWWQCRFTDYAADMNIALSYLKLLDNWEDDGSLSAYAAASALKPAYSRVRSLWPRQCAAMERSIHDLREIEKNNQEDPDGAAETFARMMAEIFAVQEDRWTPVLRELGAALGRFLYITDAVMDLDRDTVRGSYNPFRRRYGREDNGEFFRDVLQMLLAACLSAFDRLPLVEDAGILKNILCSGLWTEFQKKYQTDKDKDDGVGSL